MRASRVTKLKAWEIRPAVLAIALLLISPRALSFEPALHERYALRARTWLGQCSAYLDRLPKPVDIECLAAGARKEDDPSVERIANWHYARNEDMPRYFMVLPLPLPMRTDMERIFAQRADDVFRYAQSAGCTRAGLFERAGRMLHYIQDMRVPAHVIPINHGAGFPEDAFDKYPFRYENVSGPSKSECIELEDDRLGASRRTFDRLLHGARHETRKRIGSNVIAGNVTQPCKWAEVFWCDPRGNDCGAELSGFGMHRESRFGDRYVMCAEGRLTLEESDYEHFFAAGYRGMLKDTAVVLLLTHDLAETYCRGK